jgi:hypothetical protein
MHPNNVIHRRRAGRNKIKDMRIQNAVLSETAPTEPADGGDPKKDSPDPVTKNTNESKKLSKAAKKKK